MALKIAVDGSNLCAVDAAPKSTFRLERIVIAKRQLLAILPTAEIRIFVDANLRWKIGMSEKNELEGLIRNGEIEQVPAGITADDYILEWANRNNALVISNDQFRQYHLTYPWLVQRGSGRSITAVFDQKDGTWVFMERNAGSAPARQLIEIAGSNWEPSSSVFETSSSIKIPLASYIQRITRRAPTAFVLMVDQSGSMGESWQGGVSKSVQVASIVNNALRNLVLQATSGSGNEVRHYADVAVIGYGGVSSQGVTSMLSGTTIAQPFLPISKIASQPKVTVIENPDGTRRREVVWFDPKHGGGTPMHSAFSAISSALEFWVSNHRNSFPPVVINITDGESTDADPSSVARDITGLETDDGNVLLFTVYIGTGGGKQALYPASAPEGLSPAAMQMFQISSIVPEALRSMAEGLGIHIGVKGRGFLFNADRDEVSGLINFGTSLRLGDQT